MYTSKAYIVSHMNIFPNKLIGAFTVIAGGIVMISLLAQLKIVLPWTPVPITGQTFGVALLSLLWGSRLSVATFASYLALGFVGVPIFAGGASGFIVGPTFGYLVGMLIASWCVGKLSDFGWSHGFWTAIAACYIGSIIIYSFGILGLSFFIPIKGLLVAGVLPFLPGDFIKNILAAWSVSRLPPKN